MSDNHPDKTSDAFPEPPRLRLLRLLVTGLTATMIIGFVIIVGMLVTLVLRARTPGAVAIPAEIEIAEGERALAFTRGTDWIAVVTRNESGQEAIRIFSLDGTAIQKVPIRLPGKKE